jgi:hypothetical protein
MDGEGWEPGVAVLLSFNVEHAMREELETCIEGCVVGQIIMRWV